MTWPMSDPPHVSVVIPTYNRASELLSSLTSLAAQHHPVADFEVVVADDGSSDETLQVVRSFESRLRLRYHYQPDRGFRLALVRNNGARLATAPVLAFLDAGTIAGPEFVSGHLDLHTRPGTRAVIGYTYGYRPFDPTPGLAEMVRTRPPEQVRAHYGADPSFQDTRHRQYASVDFDVNALPLPWIMFWSVNMSLPAEVFWQLGGFDETFVDWGAEDLDLGLRLYKQGTPFVVGRDAWAIESPHERDPAGKSDAVTRNALQMLAKFPEPATELNWAWFATGEWLIQEDSLVLHERYAEFLRWVERARPMRVDTAIDTAVRDLPSGSSLAIVGCGDRLPDSVPASGVTLLDFDEQAVAAAGRERPDPVHHRLGLQIPLPDQSVDLLLITPRLGGLWPQHGPLIRQEAQRVGRTVRNLAQPSPARTP
jgi:GT2 family glycosyltransferase